jgi:hypothetical protein
MKAMTAAPPFRREKRAESTGGALFPQANKPLFPLFLVGSCRITARPSIPDQADDLILTLLLEMRATLQRIEERLDEFAASKSASPGSTPEPT